jgi:hypothetical protein
VLGQVGENQPAFAARLQVLRQRFEKSAQHPAIGIENSIFHGRTRPRRYPRRIADHQRRAAFGKEIRLDDIDAF